MGSRQSNLFGRAAKPGVSMTLSGGAQLDANLKLLTLKTQKKVSRAAVAVVARVMVKRAKKAIATGSTRAVDSGLLQKSIGFRPWTSRQRGFAAGATIGARKSFATMVARNKRGKKKGLTKGAIAKVVAAGGGFTRAQFADPSKYAHLPEAGTKQRAGGKGAVRGVRFMEHTYLRSRGDMGSRLRRELWQRITQEVAKLPRF